MEKAISVFAVALLFMSMLSPIVRAGITLTSEFVEPVKNWSLETIAESLPGVRECPPWHTNNGGWRDLRGDIRGPEDPAGSGLFPPDGVVDMWDFGFVGLAYGKTSADPDWDDYKIADITGPNEWPDEVVDIWDYGLVGLQFGKETNCIDGKHSWYTRGGGNYIMWQELNSDTLNAVKGKQVTFAFWFLPESVASDGLQNYARAEIKYFYRVNGIHGSYEVFGDWVYPNETKWHSASVTASIPSYAYSVKVVIHGTSDGTPDFKAWIDLASLSITETELVVQYESVTDLKVSLAVTLFELRVLDESKGRALLAVSMSADAPYPYVIEFTELKITLIQGINVTMRNVTQSNDADYVTDPAQTEKIENNWITAAELAISILPRYGQFVLKKLLKLTALKSVALMLVVEAGKILVMSTWRTEANIPSADDPSEYAKARINYFEYGSPIVHFANERSIAELMFNSGSSCQVEVTAKAKFRTVDGWKMGTLETSTSVTVSL